MVTTVATPTKDGGKNLVVTTETTSLGHDGTYKQEKRTNESHQKKQENTFDAASSGDIHTQASRTMQDSLK